MSLSYLFDPNKQFQDEAGNNNVDGFLRVYIDGTDDRAITYKDFDGTFNLSDITLDINGRAVVIVDRSKTYRLEVYKRDGGMLWTARPMIPSYEGGGGIDPEDLKDLVIKHGGRTSGTYRPMVGATIDIPKSCEAVSELEENLYGKITSIISDFRTPVLMKSDLDPEIPGVTRDFYYWPTARTGANGNYSFVGYDGVRTEIATVHDDNSVTYTTIEVPTASTSIPSMDGTASAGSSTQWSRGDHVHPTDTSREAVSNKAQVVVDLSTTDYPSSKAVADFVNSSIATNTANFLGTYDVVEDLGLSTSATNSQIATALGNYTFATTPTNNDYVFAAIDLYLNTGADEYRRFKFNGTAWAYEYTLNNSSFTAAQWDAINSGLSSSDKTTYDAAVSTLNAHVADSTIHVTSTDKTTWNSHVADTSNPHSVTKAQVGLSNVDNTSDANKPVSTAQQTALNNKLNIAGDNGTQAGVSKLINKLSAGDSVPNGDDCYVSEYANGAGSTNSTYHRRPIKLLWEYIKGQISSVLGLTSSSYGGKAATAGTADYAKAAASGSALDTALNSKANDSSVVHLAGAETITGVKTFNNATSPRQVGEDFAKQSKTFACSVIKPFNEWSMTEQDNNHFRTWVIDITSIVMASTRCSIVVKLMGSYFSDQGNGVLQKVITFQVHNGNVISSQSDYTIAQSPCAEEFGISDVFKSGSNYLIQVVNHIPTANNYPLRLEIEVFNRNASAVLDNVTMTEYIMEGWPAWAGDINAVHRIQSNEKNVMLEGDAAASLNASAGGESQPVYFPSSGVNIGKPVVIPFSTDQEIAAVGNFLTIQAQGAYYAHKAGIANESATSMYSQKIGTSSSVHPAIGSATQPVYVDSNGSVKPCTLKGVYLSQYNADSLSNIIDAFNSGLLVFSKYDGDVYLLLDADSNGATFVCNTTVDGKTYYSTLTVNSSNTWSRTTENIFNNIIVRKHYGANHEASVITTATDISNGYVEYALDFTDMFFGGGNSILFISLPNELTLAYYFTSIEVMTYPYTTGQNSIDICKFTDLTHDDDGNAIGANDEYTWLRTCNSPNYIQRIKGLKLRCYLNTTSGITWQAGIELKLKLDFNAVRFDKL